MQKGSKTHLVYVWHLMLINIGYRAEKMLLFCFFSRWIASYGNQETAQDLKYMVCASMTSCLLDIEWNVHLYHATYSSLLQSEGKRSALLLLDIKQATGATCAHEVCQALFLLYTCATAKLRYLEIAVYRNLLIVQPLATVLQAHHKALKQITIAIAWIFLPLLSDFRFKKSQWNARRRLSTCSDSWMSPKCRMPSLRYFRI